MRNPHRQQQEPAGATSTEDTLTPSVAEVADIEVYRARRATRLACQRTYRHLADHGLLSHVVTDTLTAIEREVTA